MLRFGKRNEFMNAKKVWIRVVEYIAIYLLTMGVAFTYFWTTSLVLGRPLRWSWGDNFIYGGVLFLAISIVLEIKYYLKKKEKTEYTPTLNTEEKLSMLKTLLDNDVLTQDEYDSMKKTLDVCNVIK